MADVNNKGVNEKGHIVGSCTTHNIKKYEREELKKLQRLFSAIPENKKELLEGLIGEAARIHAQLQELWENIDKRGLLDEDGNETVASKMFTQKDKSYQTIIKQLSNELPAEARKESKLTALLASFDDNDK